MRVLRWVVYALAALVVGVGVYAVVSSAGTVTTAPRPPPTPEVIVVASDTAIAVGPLTYKASKAVVMEGFGAYPRYSASPGAVIVAVEYRVRNDGGEQIEVADIAAPDLISMGGGEVLSPDPALTSRLRTIFTSYASPPALLSPGVELKTVVGYEVAADRFAANNDWALDFGRERLPRLPLPIKGGG